MSTSGQVSWRITGDEYVSCNCAWGCPCQFNALPTQGRCEALIGCQIREGHFGDTNLGGLRFARIYWWPGPVHEGNGTRQMIIDERATPEQRSALLEMDSGNLGGTYFEIFAAVCPNVQEPVYAPITLETDRERRQGRLVVPGIAESRAEPIKNPATGAEQRARIVLPEGFEYKEAEMANSAYLRVQSAEPLVFQHTDTYCQLNSFDWGNT